MFNFLLILSLLIKIKEITPSAEASTIYGHVIMTNSYIDQNMAAYGVGEVEIHRPYEEILEILEPSNWHKYAPETYSETTYLSGGGSPKSNYTGVLHEVVQTELLFSGIRIDNLLNINAFNTSEGRTIQYSLAKSISTDAWSMGFHNQQAGGLLLNQGAIRIIKGKSSGHGHRVIIDKNVYFNMFFMWLPLWGAYQQNSTAVLGLPQMLGPGTLQMLLQPIQRY